MEKKFFIVTKDLETKNKLEKQGFVLFSSANGIYYFENDGRLTFTEKGKVSYTNTLVF